MEPLLVFESFNFGNLDRSWIKQVWESAFTSIENVPTDYLIFLESPDIIELLNETRETVKNWISQNSDSDGTSESSDAPTEVSWNTLVALNLDVQALLAVLAYLMKRGQEFDSSQDTKQSCLRASSLYFVLLSIAGSNAFQAFHPALYEIALKTLTLSRRLNPTYEKTAKLSHVDRPRNDSFDDEDDEPLPALSKSQSVTLTKGLNGVVYDLVTMLESPFASLEIRSLEITIFHLVEMTKLADETMNDFSRLRIPTIEATPSSLAFNAYVALRLLCNSKYAKISVITRIICKYVLPQLLITGNLQLPQKQMAILRESTIHFLKTLLERHGPEVEESLITLVQHLMVKSPERLDGRQKQAVMVIKLINLCHDSNVVYEQCLKDLLQLSDHNKIVCRIFAQEIIGKYLLDLTNSQNNRSNEKNRWPKSRTVKLLLAAALSRCVDSSSMVRGRAIATFAEYTDSVENPLVREIFSNQTKRENLEMPTLEDLLDAIEDPTTDAILPTFRGIIDMLRKRSEDERALVRRSALQALRNGIIVVPELLNEATPMIKNHCRDSALTVRRYAIRVLTAILEKFPNDSNLRKDWVESVIPRIFDSETKVQEEVLDSLEKLTIAKITDAESYFNEIRKTTDLPWKILNELANNKMADHLAKVCGIWVNSGTIKNSTLTNIKSHIGTENNVGAWLLLASIGEHRSLENMTNYKDWYEKALTMNGTDNDYFASIVLQVLRHCWPSFDDQSLQKIHDDLLKYLKSYRVRVVLISHCLDILHGIGNFRALEVPSGSKKVEETMRDLMKFSETTINRLVEDDDNGNNTEDDPGEILFRAICTLGHASFLCSEKMSFDSLRILQGFLLQWNMLPTNLRDKKELQAASVAVLGQQSLRDRDIAQEMTPIFGRLLRNSITNTRDSNMANGPAVRINAAKALADICVRFTALVEPYLPDMCISMKDSNSDVRQIILVIFIQLLAEDFIKINGPFFFHILSMLSDDDPTIRQMTIFLVKDRLLSKNKSLGTQQFINSIFHFNDYERRAIGNSRSKIRTKEREVLTLPGDKNTEERRIIYDFMLERLDAPGKLTILVGITRQVLKSRCSVKRSNLEQLNVDTEKGTCVFKDMIYVLTSEHLQPNSCNKQTSDDDNLEENAIATTTTTAATSVIVEAMRKHRLNVLLPGLVELKRRLDHAKSNLVGDVAKIVSKIVGDYNKDQLENLYNEYPNLDKEIERDIRKCERRRGGEEDLARGRGWKTSTPKKTRLDASLLIDPDRLPRIVLRRLSSLTYPRISELQRISSSFGNSEIGLGSGKRGIDRSRVGRSSPRKGGRDFADEDVENRDKR